jgi:hypothetical protein
MPTVARETAPPRPALSTPLRAAALVTLLFVLAMTLLASGFSLLARPPLPDLTRPLPVAIPRQGAVR